MLAFDIDVFADINQLGLSSSIDSMVEFNGEAYFVADDGRTGSELWKSDGTAGGTVQVADILPGPDGSQPEGLTVLGGDLFFTALDADYEQDLWKVDGTTGGAMLVFDANDNGVYYLKNLTASGGLLFFTAYEYNSGYELWKSDGTSAGTALVKDINNDQTIIDGPQELTDVNGTLFFTSYDSGYYNRELWKSNGTAAGTVMVKDLGIDDSDPGNPDPSVSSNPYNLTNVNGQLFFAAEDFNLGIELFTSDGTVGGTFLVSDINPGPDSSYPADLTALGSEVFFSADDGMTGRQLFKSDGTGPGTMMVANTAGGTNPSNPTNFAVVGGELYFAAEGAVPATTIAAVAPTLLADNSILSGNSQAGIITDVTAPNRGLLGHFAGTGAITARQMDANNDGPGFVTNGKIGDPGVALTTLAVNDYYMTDIDGGDLANDSWEWTISDPGGLTNIDFSGFATGNEFDTGNEGIVFELFLNNNPVRTDFLEVFGNDLDNWSVGRGADNIDITHAGGASITTATVKMRIGRDAVTDLVAQYSEAILVNAQLTADLSGGTTQLIPVGRELHKTDGTAVGTQLIKDIGVNSDSNPSNLTESGGLLFFSADEIAGTGRELWVSDGSEAGTMLLVDSRPGTDAYSAPYDGNPNKLTDVAGTLFFTTEDPSGDRELWTSDGTAGNTSMVTDINIGTQSAEVQQLVQVGSLLYFVADNGIDGQGIYVADPVAETVTAIPDATPMVEDQISGLAKFRNGVAYFNSAVGTNGEIFYYDGTGSNPVSISSQMPIAFNLDGDLFAESLGEDLLYFVSDDVSNGEELWSSDGSSGGTMMVGDLNTSGSSSPRSLIEHNNKMHFTADDGYNGRELFYAASSGEGLVLVLDINPTGSSDPEDLTVVGNDLFFSADDGTSGRELWTDSGFSTNHNPNGDSNPTNLTNAGGVLYYSADDGTSGREPYKSDGTVGGTAQVADVAPLGISSDPDDFVDVGGTVYFAATESNRGVLLEKFGGITGTTIAALTGAPNYPNSPDTSSIVTDFEAPTNVDDNYGLRARAYLTVPESGDYTFWIASDDNGSLLLSTDTDPANATEIALVPQWSNSREYDKFTQQMSAPISLVAGQHYYIEALMKEQGGGDNLSVAWAGPNIVGPSVIPAEYLTRFGVTPGDVGTGRELWSTDGTPAGTALVADLQPGLDSSNPEPKASTGMRVLMSAVGTGTKDRELWSSGSTSETTLLVEDLNFGDQFASNPDHFFAFGDEFLFVANNGLVGNELFRLREFAPADPSVEVDAPPGVYPPVAEVQRSTFDSLTLLFNEPVTVSSSAIELRNRNTNEDVTLIVNPTVNASTGETIVEITFDPSGDSVIDRDPLGTTGLLDGLEDGNYELTVRGAEIESLATGMNMEADMVKGDEATDLLFRYYADFDGDRDVDTGDLLAFASTYRSVFGSPNYNEEMDFEGDGDVDTDDLIKFAQHFRTSLGFV